MKLLFESMCSLGFIFNWKLNIRLCSLLAGFGADIHVIVKIESADSIPNLHSIITASDGVRIHLMIQLLYC